MCHNFQTKGYCSRSASALSTWNSKTKRHRKFGCI